MIPKIIHTCWFTKKKNFQLPDKVKRCIDSWKRFCPDYEIKIWTIEDWPEMNNIPHAKQCWDAGVASYAYLSNIFRFWVLYNHGGFYVESDVFLKKSLDDFLEDTVVLGEINPNEISGNLMGSVKNHPIMKHLYEKTAEKVWIKKDNSLNIYHDTGFLGDEVKNFGCNFPIGFQEKLIINGISFYPKNYFVPANYQDGIYAFHSGTLSHYRGISIVMPVYNSEKYLREAINSILDQDFTDYELLCIDDGSTDNSAEIIKSYDDDRIVYIKKEHSGIVDSLNIGFKRAIGIFIVRMDSDDIMLPGRLKHQYSYMTNHPDVDILSSGFQWGNGKEIPEYWRPTERYIQLKELEIGNMLAHPTVILKRDSILKLPYLYENYFQGCEDYKLWLHSLQHGLLIKTEPTPVLIYRQHEGQETVKTDYHSTVGPLVEQAKRMYIGYKKETPEKVELTCIIPFQNEGSEIERTVANIRGTAGANVRIILINDASTDNYDYEWIARHYDCQYYHNHENLGVAGSRDFGVKHCITKYFVLLDGHMRFYHDNWHINLLRELDNNPGCLVTANTIVFTYDNDTNLYSNENGTHGRDVFGSYGAIVNMKEPGWEFTGKWTRSILKGYGENDTIIPISCCMGAVYATSKEFWNKIGGLQGLKKYGSDEPLMSLKTWLSGGKVLLMKNWGVGHLYRGNSPYSIPLKSLDQNHIYLINLFGRNSEEIQKYENNLKNRIGINRFNLAKQEFEEQREDFNKFKEYFFNDVAVRSLDWFLTNINNDLV